MYQLKISRQDRKEKNIKIWILIKNDDLFYIDNNESIIIDFPEKESTIYLSYHKLFFVLNIKIILAPGINELKIYLDKYEFIKTDKNKSLYHTAKRINKTENFKINKDYFPEIFRNKKYSSANFFIRSEDNFFGMVNNFLVLNQEGDFYVQSSQFEFNIRDILSIDLLIDETSSSGLTGGITGGLIFGGIGAAIGMLATRGNKISKIELHFTLDDIDKPSQSFYFLNIKDGQGNIRYLKANHAAVLKSKDEFKKFIAFLTVVDKHVNNSRLSQKFNF